MSDTPFKDVTIEPHAKIKQLIERFDGQMAGHRAGN